MFTRFTIGEVLKLGRGCYVDQPDREHFLFLLILGAIADWCWAGLPAALGIAVSASLTAEAQLQALQAAPSSHWNVST